MDVSRSSLTVRVVHRSGNNGLGDAGHRQRRAVAVADAVERGRFALMILVGEEIGFDAFDAKLLILFRRVDPSLPRSSEIGAKHTRKPSFFWHPERGGRGQAVPEFFAENVGKVGAELLGVNAAAINVPRFAGDDVVPLRDVCAI